MLKYFFHRLLLVIPTLIGISITTFAITRCVPGGPMERAVLARQMNSGEGRGTQAMGARPSGEKLSTRQLTQLKKFYGLDKPTIPAYIDWVKKLVKLDFGKSTRWNDPVLPMILERVPVSLLFGLTALILSYLVSIPLGIAKALRHRKLFDNITSAVVFVGYALPGYIVGILLLSVLSFKLGLLPLGGLQSDGYAQLDAWGKLLDRGRHMLLPIVCYTIGDFAFLTLSMKNNLMENMAADYIKTAMAKGRTFSGAMWFHALRNSIIPIAASFGSFIGVFLAGSYLIENVFNIRGMGMLGFTALVDQDYPVVMGLLTITAFLTLLGHILSDFIVSLVDPRIRYGK